MAGIEAYLSGASDDHLEMHKTAHRFDGSLDHLNELVKRLGTTINNVHGRLNSLETQIANLGLRDSFPPRPAPCTYQPPYCTPAPYVSDGYRDFMHRTLEAATHGQVVAGGPTT